MAGSGFTLVGSSDKSFSITSTAVSAVYALESTGRFWDKGGTGRAVRISNVSADDFYINFGSSLITAVVGTSFLVNGGVAEIFDIASNQDYIATVSTTSVSFNVSLGRRAG